ncbi:MAG: flagellar biosynthetic protein FliR [Phycisphaerae bacterium]|nr:flagellar biosynthetic protein FliR [Phycisphaerae bacterium]
MNASATIGEHLPGFALVLSRLTGIFLFAPLFSSPALPRKIRALLAFGFAAAVYPAVVGAGSLPSRLEMFDLVPLMGSELLIGLAIGVLASIPLFTAQLAGVIMGQQMGLGLASVYNPAVDFEGDTLGQVLFFVALASYLVAGGLESVFGALLSTFESIRIGGLGAQDTPLDLLVAITASGFSLALRLALPVLLILMLESVAVGFIMKTVPGLNIMNIGFPIRILLGLFMVVSSMVITIEVLMGEIGADLAKVKGWAAGL